ncbi:MAG TPA: hypothetical protein VKT81_20285 [Bryobacteraceae bacterium]|nr:hypothetical protein [Bryobacteraceae bacterium]
MFQLIGNTGLASELVLVIVMVPCGKSSVIEIELGGGPEWTVSVYSHWPQVEVPAQSSTAGAGAEEELSKAEY